MLDVTRLIWRRWKGRRPTGIDRVAIAYLRHFQDRAQAVVQHERYRRILDRRASRQLFALLDDPGDRFKSSLLLGALRNIARASRDGRGRPYLNVGHTGLDSRGFEAWTAAANVRPIYLVHDLIPITHPHFCRPGEQARHRERMLTVLRTGAGVIGNSQVTLDGLAAFARSESLDLPPSLAAWLGRDPLPTSLAVHQSGRSAFVALGTIEGRKNHLLLLDVWSRLIGTMGADAPQLFIIGQRGWEAEQVFNRLDHDDKLRGHVIEVSGCSDEELGRHLVSARALLFPSFAEGYGLPLVEALGAGLPAIASDLPVFREIGGQIPVYLDPDDADEWEAAIRDFAAPGSTARAEQLKRIESFRAPDWPTHFAAVEAWIESLD